MGRARGSLQGGSRGHPRLDARRVIELHHVTDGPARGWLHTHGLAARGMPELEIRVLEAGPDESAGYDAGHYRTARLVLVDPPADGCACDACASEISRRPPLAS